MAVVLTVAMVGHRLVPAFGSLAMLWESFLPWVAVLFVCLLIVALARRSALGILATAVGLVAWAIMFVPQLVPHDDAGGADFSVATQNIGANLSGSRETARGLARSGASIVVVEELSGANRAAVSRVLGRTFEHDRIVGTVGIWSRFPLSDTVPLSLGTRWARGISVTATTDKGAVQIYAVHLPSVRVGLQADRDTAMDKLATLTAGNRSPRVLVVGDLNTAGTDRNFDRLTDQLIDSRQQTGGGFGFTWPARAPMTRLDHVLGKGVTFASDRVLSSVGSDHRGVLAAVNLD